MKSWIIPLLIIGLVPLAFAQEPKPVPNIDTQLLESQIADQINLHRQSIGLNKLVFDPGVQAVAKQHLEKLAATGLYQHETPGTTINAAKRAIAAGYGLCGDLNDIKKYQDTMVSLKGLQAKVADYNQKALAYKSQPNNIGLRNYIIQQQQQIMSERSHVKSDISYVNSAIQNNRIGYGFEEVLNEINVGGITDNSTLAKDVLQSWLNSPLHKRALEDPAHSFGVSAIIDSEHDRVLMSANTC